MFEKLILIGTLLSITGVISLYNLYRCKKKLRLDIIVDLIEKEEITITDAEYILSKVIRNAKFNSYIISIILSVDMCYIFALPYIFCINFLENNLLLMFSILVEVLVFLTTPKFFLKQHQELSDTLDSTNEEFLSIIQEAYTLNEAEF